MKLITPFHKTGSVSVRVPGSKSITNRALAMATLMLDGLTIENACICDDTERMMDCLQQLGYCVRADGIRITVFQRMATRRFARFHVGDSGTTARIMTALVCLQPDSMFTFSASAAMSRRPMRGLIRALESLGQSFEFHGEPYCFPFTIRTAPITADKVTVDASETGQAISALLIMGAGLRREFTILNDYEPTSLPFVRMTCKMLDRFGATAVCGERFAIVRASAGLAHSGALAYCVEPDATAASYFSVLELATRMTGYVDGHYRSSLQGDAAFDLVVSGMRCHRHQREIQAGFNFSGFSDTFLTLAAITPLYRGKIRIHGIGHTRKQECNRIACVAAELRKLGQVVTELDDGLEIQCSYDALKAVSARGIIGIETHGDHRMAMSFAILGCHDLHGDGLPWLAIRNAECCRKTFPDFFAVLDEARLAE